MTKAIRFLISDIKNAGLKTNLICLAVAIVMGTIFVASQMHHDEKMDEFNSVMLTIKG